ncbi:MAG: phosphoglycerate mutase [Chromatiales bacterium]|nr:phosphoglycerate mutase [Chromatiales bacterium]
MNLQAPAIERLLARADRLPSPDRDPLAAWMCAAGVESPTEAEAPTAPLALLGEGEAVESGAIWMHADPIHVRPDRDRLLIYAGKGIAPDRAEADALVETFNRHFADDGLSLLAPTPARWYLRLARPLSGLRTSPLYQVQGGSMAEHLPRGPESRDWIRLLNEIQMLFHADPVNRRREANGRPMISGVWTWGAGSLPALSGSVPDALVGDHPLIAGLGRLARTPVSLAGVLARRPHARCTGRRLVLWDRHWRAWLDQDLDAWSCAMTALDAVIERSWVALRTGRPAAIRLDPCCGTVFRITSGQTWRLWRRRTAI